MDTSDYMRVQVDAVLVDLKPEHMQGIEDCVANGDDLMYVNVTYELWLAGFESDDYVVLHTHEFRPTIVAMSKEDFIVFKLTHGDGIYFAVDEETLEYHLG